MSRRARSAAAKTAPHTRLHEFKFKLNDTEIAMLDRLVAAGSFAGKSEVLRYLIRCAAENLESGS